LQFQAKDFIENVELTCMHVVKHPLEKKLKDDDNSTLCKIGESKINAKHFEMKMRLRRIDAMEDIKID